MTYRLLHRLPIISSSLSPPILHASPEGVPCTAAAYMTHSIRIPLICPFSSLSYYLTSSSMEIDRIVLYYVNPVYDCGCLDLALNQFNSIGSLLFEFSQTGQNSLGPKP